MSILLSLAAAGAVMLFVAGVATRARRGGLAELIALYEQTGQPANPPATPRSDDLPRLARLLAASGIGWSPRGLGLALGVSGLVTAAVVAAVSGQPAIGILVGILLPPLSWYAVLSTAADRRQRALENDLVRFLASLSTMVGVGRDIASAIGEVAVRLAGPLGKELTLVSHQLDMGVSLSEALAASSHRVQLGEYSSFCQAVTLSQESGGNVLPVLRHLLASLVERHRARADLKSKLAELKLVKNVMIVFPVLLLTLYSLASKAQLNGLMHGDGLVAGIGAAIFYILGVFVTQTMLHHAEGLVER